MAEWQPKNRTQNLNGTWKLITDPQNQGKEDHWHEQYPWEAAEDSVVPGIIQQIFPGYHGVVWYSLRFMPAIIPFHSGRLQVCFGAVEYSAEVWLNGTLLGQHEGGETPFIMDATGVLQLGIENILVVRVVNPTNDLIDGFTLKTIPHRNKAIPYATGCDYDWGGILQPVDLVAVPDPWIADIFTCPEGITGILQVTITIQNQQDRPVNNRLSITIAPDAGGDAVASAGRRLDIPPGSYCECVTFHLQDPRLWSLDDPFLYRLTITLGHQTREVRCGIRQFRFDDGYFRINGRRIFLKSSHTGNDFPIGLHVPPTPDLLLRNIYLAKSLGFNMIRFIAGLAFPAQLDLCDELGLLVYEESLAAWMLEDSPSMCERYDLSVGEMVWRDRNHPCIVIWGLLNETPNDAIFQHVVSFLPVLRALDESRLVLLNSGRWDKQLQIGSLSNPKSSTWECLLGSEAPDAMPEESKGIQFGTVAGAGDVHYYPSLPLKPESIQFLRTLGQDSQNVFLSEHGCGSEVDVIRLVRLFEQFGAREDLEDYLLYKSQMDKYLADWDRLKLGSMFPNPEQLFHESHLIQALHRHVAFTAIRANPHLCGFNMTGLVDQGRSGEGCMATTFRELKPLAAEILSVGWAPLRWCLFVEPVHGYRGRPVKVEGWLANEGVLLPGKYAISWQVIGPQGWVGPSHEATLQVPDPNAESESPFAFPAFEGEIIIDGPEGQYEIMALFENGASPLGDSESFFISDPQNDPKPATEVAVWEKGSTLIAWLNERAVPCHSFRPQEGSPLEREIILVGGLESPSSDRRDWEDVVGRIFQGCTVIFLTPSVFTRNNDLLYWMPLEINGVLTKSATWAAGRDDFAKDHPIFAGMLAGGLLDPIYYRDIIPEKTFDHQDPPPDEVVAGAIGVGYYPTADKMPYYIGTHIGVYHLGEGRFIINALLINKNLGQHPAADRLLLNLLQYAQSETNLPPAELPSDFHNRFSELFP